MKLFKNQNSLLALACGFAFVALPGAFAAANDAKHSPEAMFKMADTNGDGMLSREESTASQKQMFTDMDTDHDGMVTVAEMTAAQTKMNDGNSDRNMKDEMTAADMIRMHDTNSDGKLSAEEHMAGCDMMFEKTDTNHDGSLSLDECKAAKKMMKKKSA